MQDKLSDIKEGNSSYQDFIEQLTLLSRYKPSSRDKVQEYLENGDLENAYLAYSWDSDKHSFYKEYIKLRKDMYQELRRQFSGLDESDFVNRFSEIFD